MCYPNVLVDLMSISIVTLNMDHESGSGTSVL
jgi:hypothetical protein